MPEISLSDILYEEEKQVLTTESAKEEFTVDSTQKADWAIAKIAQAKKRIDQRKQFVKASKEKLDNWFQKESVQDENAINYLEFKVEPYVREQIQGLKKKSLNLLAGTAGFRKGTEKLELFDEKAVLDYCKEHHPEALEVKVSKSEVKKLLQKGIKVPGATLEEARDSFYVRPNDELIEFKTDFLDI